MALFRQDKKDWDFEVIPEGEENILYIYVEDIPLTPSIEDSSLVFAKTIDILLQVSNISKIIFTQQRDYEYDYNQVQLLLEFADIYKQLYKQKTLFSYSSQGLSPVEVTRLNQRYAEVQNLVFKLLKGDPIGAFIELRRTLRRERISLEKTVDQRAKVTGQHYVSILGYIIKILDNTKLITLAKPHLAAYQQGDRSVYRMIFTPYIRPDFMFTKLMADYPKNGEEIDSYSLEDDTEVTIFKFPDSIETLYHIIPPEFKLSEDKYELLDTARKIMAEHKPREEEFTDPKRMREVFSHVGRDMLEELAETKGINLRSKELDRLTKILVRYTVGFGLIEVLLSDEKIQDVSVNSPLGRIPLFLVHGKYDDCTTNIIPTMNEAESWATKLRLISGRPLDEANPILDTELELPGATTRVSTITRPLDPTGIAFSFRRHRDRPWTLPLFVENKMLTAEAAGLISFLVDGTRSMIVAGTRSSGKTSFLSAILVEIMRRYRMITVEDTLELPAKSLRELGYNIQQMKVAPALERESTEMSAADGIRSTLRLGDSALIVGEVRSKEAVALYEAMRVGAAANVVAGTIHGDSPYGVFDRVVNDIGVPKTSFKATDIIIVANPIKSAGGLHKFRRITQITEVRKTWQDDPMTEGGFMDLMKYDAKKDALEISKDLINGDSEILKAIAGNIKEFAGNWDAVWDNIMLRGKIKQAVVDAAKKTENRELLEAPFTIKANDTFHVISDNVKEEVGALDPKAIMLRWNQWLKRELRKKELY